MHYVQAFDRDQFMMNTWDSMVDPESTARLIDASVDSLDLADYGVLVNIIGCNGKKEYKSEYEYAIKYLRNYGLRIFINSEVNTKEKVRILMRSFMPPNLCSACCKENE